MSNVLQALDADQSVPRAERIARLNDALRKSGEGGAIMVTHGVRALPGFDVETMLLLLQTYQGFDEDNDPHGERDFGDLAWNDTTTLLFKTDYYDVELAYASPDPADPAVTKRILTVMLQSEW